MSLLLSFHTMRTYLNRSKSCLCDHIDATSCQCKARCKCHLGPTTRALLTVARVARTRPRPFPVAEYATVPRSDVLGKVGRYPRRSVQCCRCGTKLRAGEPRAVVKVGPDRWRCGTVGEVGCRTQARVPSKGRPLAWLLAQSMGGGMVVNRGS
jgi:hypothetical protein